MTMVTRCCRSDTKAGRNERQTQLHPRLTTLLAVSPTPSPMMINCVRAELKAKQVEKDLIVAVNHEVRVEHVTGEALCVGAMCSADLS